MHLTDQRILDWHTKLQQRFDQGRAFRRKNLFHTCLDKIRYLLCVDEHFFKHSSKCVFCYKNGGKYLPLSRRVPFRSSLEEFDLVACRRFRMWPRLLARPTTILSSSLWQQEPRQWPHSSTVSKQLFCHGRNRLVAKMPTERPSNYWTWRLTWEMSRCCWKVYTTCLLLTLFFKLGTNN